MKDEKQQLEVKVVQLEAQVRTVRLNQTRNRFHFDDTHLARCKATLASSRPMRVITTTAQRYLSST